MLSKSFSRAATLCAVFGFSFSNQGAAMFQRIGFLPSTIESSGTATSRDGKLVVGNAEWDTGGQAVRWSATTGIRSLGTPPGSESYSYAVDVSDDGKVIVGSSDRGTFIWREVGGLVNLNCGYGGGISRDGKTVALTVDENCDFSAQRPAIWTAANGVQLFTLPAGYSEGATEGISGDGKVVIGYMWDNSMNRHGGFLRGSDGVVREFPTSSELLDTTPRAASDDGSVIVGSGHTEHGRRAFRWNSAGFQVVGGLPGYPESVATGVSGDGKIIIGTVSFYSTEPPYEYGEKPFIWDAEHGIRDLKVVLETEHGLNLSGWKLMDGSGISGDGTTFVGDGMNPEGKEEGWVATIPRMSDTSRPTVAFTAPAANFHTTTANLAISGTANDNVSVEAVEYRIENAAGTNSYASAEGTTSWSISVELPAGPSTIRVRARDNSGNLSTEVTRVFYFDKASPFSVAVIGSGVVSPNLNGSNLVVGKKYAMTASPRNGFTFDGWSGLGTGVVKSATVSFPMTENLSLTARFVDRAKPSVVITAPRNSQKLSNNVMTVTGTAKDNHQVAVVRVQVNDQLWTDASGLESWNISAALTPGSNKIRAYVLDAAGNGSSTNLIAVLYVKVAPFTASAGGGGKIAPNLTGNLEVNKTYSITATPLTGFRFVGWNGDIETNKNKLTFTMPDGPLNVMAHFADAAAPSVIITAPIANARITTNRVLVKGTAKDNVGVSRVLVKLDNGEWVEAGGTTNWSQGIEPDLGKHTVQVYSVDAAGNRSKTNSVAFRLPDYRGVYFGSYSEPGGRGLVGVLVTADQKAVMLTGDNTASYSYSDIVDGVQIALDGKFDFTLPDGERRFGIFTDSGFTGTFVIPGETPSKFSGSKKAATGKQAALAGLYVGSYENNEDQGEARALVAADGQTQVFTHSSVDAEESDDSAGAGLGSINDVRQLRVILNGAMMIATADNQTFEISGTGFSLERVATPDTSAPGFAPRLGEIITGLGFPKSSGVEIKEGDASTLNSPMAVPISNGVKPKSSTIHGTTPAEPPIVSIDWRENGVGLVFSTQVGRTYRVQASSDLVSWKDITSAFMAAAEKYEFMDPAITGVHRFYRVVAE